MSNATVVPARHGRALVALHWVTFLLVVVVYAAMELRGFAPRGSGLRAIMRDAHVQLGTLVFLLTAVRLVVRTRARTPWGAAQDPAWSRFAAATLHACLYLLLLAMPAIGWLMLSAEGRGVAFLGIEWPLLIAPDRALAHDLEELHELLANVGYALVGLHAAAALAHHYFWRDDTLKRMLPRRA